MLETRELNSEDNLYAQFLTADRHLSFDRIMRIAKFRIDSHLAESQQANVESEFDQACCVDA